jgi:abortive infection bacteriophage resistance protein
LFGKNIIKQRLYTRASASNTFVNPSTNFQKIIATYFEQSEAIQHYLTTYGFVPLWVLETKMNFGDLTHFYAVLETNIRQSVSKKYDLADDDFGTIMHVLNITRNCCAHKERLYCIKHNVMLPRLDKNRHQKIVHFTSKGEGDKNLFSAVLGLYIILGEKEINPMLNSIKSEIDSLSKKLKTISIKNIEAIMGFPSDWYTTLSSSHKPSIKTLERA